MSIVTRTHCDNPACGASIHEKAPYASVETKRVGVPARVDACSKECAIALVVLLWQAIDSQRDGKS